MFAVARGVTSASSRDFGAGGGGLRGSHTWNLFGVKHESKWQGKLKLLAHLPSPSINGSGLARV